MLSALSSSITLWRPYCDRLWRLPDVLPAYIQRISNYGDTLKWGILWEHCAEEYYWFRSGVDIQHAQFRHHVIQHRNPLSKMKPVSLSVMPLQWRYDGRESVSNHQPHDCLLNGLFRRRSKKTWKLRATGLCAGIHRGPVNSPHKWPVKRKMFPFDDVIMQREDPTVAVSVRCKDFGVNHIDMMPFCSEFFGVKYENVIIKCCRMFTLDTHMYIRFYDTIVNPGNSYIISVNIVFVI